MPEACPNPCAPSFASLALLLGCLLARAGCTWVRTFRRQPVAGNPDCTGPVLESSTITHRVDSIYLDLLLNQLQYGKSRTSRRVPRLRTSTLRNVHCLELVATTGTSMVAWHPSRPRDRRCVPRSPGGAYASVVMGTNRARLRRRTTSTSSNPSRTRHRLRVAQRNTLEVSVLES